MLKMIHADLYKTFHRAYFFIMTLVVSGLCVALVFAMRGEGVGNWTGAAGIGAALLEYPVFLLPMLTQIVYAEEFRDHTLKNTIAFGTNRTALYISKWLTIIILGVIMAAVVLFFFFGTAALILPRDSDFTWDLIKEFFERFGASCLIYIAGISMSVFFIQLFNKSTLAIFLYYGGFYLTDLLLSLIKCNKGIDYLLKTQMSAMMYKPIDQLRDPIIITLVTMAVFFVAGIVFFRKKDFS